MNRLFKLSLLAACAIFGFASTASAEPCELERDGYGVLFGDCDLSMWDFEKVIPVHPLELALPNLTPTQVNSRFWSGQIDLDTTIDNNGPKDAGSFEVSTIVHVYEMLDLDGDTIVDGEQYLRSYNQRTAVNGIPSGTRLPVGIMQIVPSSNATLRFDVFVNVDANYHGVMGRMGEVWENNERDQRMQYSCWLYGDEPLFQAQTEHRIPICA